MDLARDVVMVIDDDPDLRLLISMCLTNFCLRVVEAADCAAALPLLARERGHLRAVLLDYFMPGLTPCDCVAKIHATIEPGVPIILVSAAANIAERAAELGLDRFLAKPFDIDDLVGVLGRAA